MAAVCGLLPAKAWVGPRQRGSRRTARCVPREATFAAWSDEFTALDDRHDVAPLPLPSLQSPVSVTLVRHGQSTWNAEGRIQGSSDESELTQKGLAQAECARQLLAAQPFDALFVSPLRRARQTASVVWGDRPGGPTLLPSLREVDLYSLQGLEKAQAKQSLGPVYASWQAAPAAFELHGHAPVRELWHRASLAWRSVLGAQAPRSLLVAHNAINQALLGAACGWPPAAFRRFEQSNGALTVLSFTPGEDADAPATARVLCVNVSSQGWAKSLQPGAILLVVPPASPETLASNLRALNAAPIPLLHSSSHAARALATSLPEYPPQMMAELESHGGDAARAAWLAALSATAGGTTCVVVAAEAPVVAALLCEALHLPANCAERLRLDPGGCSVLQPGKGGGPASASCVNAEFASGP